MCMLKFLGLLLAIGVALLPSSHAQNAPNSPKPAAHVIGTVTATNPAAHTIQVKQDKTGTEYTVSLENTKTLLKVEPGAKDLKNATRFTASDLAAGDRVDVYGTNPEGSNTIAARSVLLITARDLQKAHQAEAAAWQRSTAGVVTLVDPSAQKLTINVRTPAGPKAVTVEAQKTTDFTRYSPETPKTPAPSQIADIHPGDQVRVIGQTNADDSTITAEKIYSGAFRTVPATVLSIAPDGKSMTVRSLTTKQPIAVAFNQETAVRKLTPQVAMMLARRLNPTFRQAAATGGNPQTSDNAAGASPYAAKAPEANARERAGPGAGSQGANTTSPRGPIRAGASGDLSQLIERMPQIPVTDLKPGDAVVVSGATTGADSSHLIATNIVAGVEPIFQSAPPRQAESLGNWNLDMSIPAQQ